MRRLIVPVLGLWWCAVAVGAPFTVEDLVRLKRITDPQVSPDGHWLAFVERETDLEANAGRTGLWLLELGRAGASPQRLTPATTDTHPRWAPDSRTLYFLSARSGSSQVWRLALPSLEAQPVTQWPLDVTSLKVSPRGDRLAVTMEVFLDCEELGCSATRLSEAAHQKASGHLYQRLFVRHWDSWDNGTRSHLFTAPLSAGRAGAPVDVARGLDGDVPSKPFGDDEDYAFSPDGQRLVFSARVAARGEPWSTNFDLYEVHAAGGAAPVNLTTDSPAADVAPVFLTNGDLAWLQQRRPGFESDRFHVMLRRAHGGAVRELAAGWDRSVAALAATPDGRSLIGAADEEGQHALFRIEVRSGAVQRLTGEGTVEAFSVAAEAILAARADLGAPADLYRIALGGGPAQRLTQVNAELLGARALSSYESFTFPGWNGETVHGYVMQPAGMRPGERYPVAFLVHGGPQVSMQNLWTYRWNAQAFAGGGYGVVMIDFHGSPGYGQAFTDSISRDWGGKPLVDLQKGLAAALARYPWLDGERVCALGASYGGFMMNWIEGNWPERFRCLVNHDGLFDQRMMYYSTEELWFPEWEFGAPYYQDPQAYERFNPVNFVSAWRTPMLVIHGEQDFRIPYDQGLAAFTALQRRGIESRLLIFPNENHWVLKPADSEQWYHTVLGWLDAHLKR
ncbi:MAG: S9 family peptidase [Gammaproteobacteria bacterium]|nr:S9 family peptidase [Gammaproteobacteria bacterium]